MLNHFMNVIFYGHFFGNIILTDQVISDIKALFYCLSLCFTLLCCSIISSYLIII